MPRAVGLDIGSHAVRAAEVNLGHPPELVGFGQVGLPRGAVEHGEVIDPGTVAAAIRRLWSEARLRDRRVRLGLASLRTIIRQVEVPAMAEDELRGALEFQAGDFIPLPPEETLLDFQVVEQFESPDGETLMRVLIAAIHRDTLQTALSAVREAGLQAVAVDLAPFALVRSLAAVPGALLEAEPTEQPAAEVIVSVGSGVTIVVIHEAGVVRFVRIVNLGGDELTVAIQQALDVTFEEAEALKRQLGAGAPPGEEAITAIEAPLSSLVNEIRGSVDFYVAQAGARPLQRAVLTGGGTLLDGFGARITETLGVPAEAADPMRYLRMGDVGFLPEQLPSLRPYLPVALGLALAADRLAVYRINLLPERERRVVPIGRMAVAGAAVATVVVGSLGLLTMQRNDALAGARDDLEQQQATNQGLQARIGSLQGARELQAEADAARALLASVVQNEVSWSRVLQDLARVIPNDVWLDQFQGSGVAATQTGADQAGGEQVVTTGLGSLTFTATGTSFPSAAAWLQRLSTLPSIDSPWLGQITRGDISVGGIGFEGVTFASNANLTDAARTERSRRFAAQAGTTPTTAPGAGGEQP